MVNTQVIKKVALLGVGLAVGGGTGYFVARQQFLKQIDKELSEQRERLSLFNKTGPYATPEDAAAVLIPDEPITGEKITLGQKLVQQSLREAEESATIAGEDFLANKAAGIQESTAFNDDEEERLRRFEIARDEIELLNKNIPEGEETPAQAELREELEATIKNYQEEIKPYGGVSLPDSVTRKNIFEDQPFEVVVDLNGPYIITEEMYQNDVGNEKVTVAYWEGDETLTDDNERIISDIDTAIGLESLTKFGVGTQDEDAVYVRNTRRGVDYEIVRNTHSYSEVVLGVKPEKPGKPVTGKMPSEDDDI